MRSTGRFFLSSGGAFVETRFPSYRGLYVTLAHSCSSLPPAVHAANTVSYRRTRAAWPTDENCKIASRTIQRVRLAAGIREQKGNCRDAERRRGRWWPPVLRAGALRMLELWESSVFWVTDSTLFKWTRCSKWARFNC